MTEKAIKAEVVDLATYMAELDASFEILPRWQDEVEEIFPVVGLEAMTLVCKRMRRTYAALPVQDRDALARQKVLGWIDSATKTLFSLHERGDIVIAQEPQGFLQAAQHLCFKALIGRKIAMPIALPARPHIRLRSTGKGPSPQAGE